MIRRVPILSLLILGLPAASLGAQGAPGGRPAIELALDASDAPRHLLHATLRIPAAPGPLTLFYPKWIPGEHGPTGPIADLVNLRFSAGGQRLPWRRDDVEMYAIHLQVPAGAHAVDVNLDFLTPSGGKFSGGPSATDALALLSWNQVLLYPLGQSSDSLTYEAKVKLPSGWSFGTALPVARQEGATVTFQPVTLTTLVDSPVLTGSHFKRVDLGESLGRPHHLDMAADGESALAITPATVQHYRDLVTQSGALFGARHYLHYDFLLTLSDDVAHFGLEHHQSSDDRVPEGSLVDPALLKTTAGLLPHEMVHSWNGKFRRPAGLATGNYDAPMKGELLWIYEGLTEYLGSILTARSGLWTPEDYREHLAMVAAALDHEPGRAWRPLADTAVEAQVLYDAPPTWAAFRRSVDFYPEGLLIWLDADTLIRERSGGKKSLDDFCRAFEGGASTGPMVKPYGLDEVLAALNRVVPYDWAGFFRTRVEDLAPRAPLGGLERGGWHLAYGDAPTDLWKAMEQSGKLVDVTCSLGLRLGADGGVMDVLPGTPAFLGGFIPGMKVVSVDGARFSPSALHEAIKAGQTGREPLSFVVSSGAFVKTLRVDYHGGERYPRLERIAGNPDRLADILRPLAVPAR